MKTINKLISSTFVFAFACTLALGVANAAPEAIELTTTAIETVTGSDFSAAAISAEDKPDLAFSSGLRQVAIGIINYLLTFLGLIAVGFIIYAGVLMVMDAGAEENVGKAKNIIIYAAVGIIIILMSYTIVNAIFGVGETVA